MKYRKLRIAWSVAWGIAVVLLLALWVRSYTHLQIVEKRIGSQTVEISSLKDHFAIASLHPAAGIGTFYLSTASVNAADWRTFGAAGFAYYHNSLFTVLIIPHWLVAFVAATVGAGPWFHWSSRFSLRTLLIATTLIAVGLALAAWATK